MLSLDRRSLKFLAAEEEFLLALAGVVLLAVFSSSSADTASMKDTFWGSISSGSGAGTLQEKKANKPLIFHTQSTQELESHLSETEKKKFKSRPVFNFE